MNRLRLTLLLVSLFPLGPQLAHAAPPLAALTVRLGDLRAGYVLASARYRTRSRPAVPGVTSRLLLSHGWTGGYDALYRRRDDPRVEVGDSADAFTDPRGAHWWYQASLLRVPSGYHTIRLARVGDESTAVQSRAFVGIIFRRGVGVVDVYVSLTAPFPQGSVSYLARLVDRRLQSDQPQLSARAQRPPPRPQLTVWVHPNPLPGGSYPTLLAQTAPGAVCLARIVYADGSAAAVLPASRRAADARGRVSWFWYASSPAAGGTASVSCTERGAIATGRATFTLIH